MKFLHTKGIDAKKHYPIPMHLQLPCRKMGNYKKGDFPFAEKLCDETLSLPIHEFVTKNQIKYMVKNIKIFYSKKINSQSPLYLNSLKFQTRSFGIKKASQVNAQHCKLNNSFSFND